MKTNLITIADQSNIELWSLKGWIIFIVGSIFVVWLADRIVNKSPMHEPETSMLDEMAGIVVPCPPSHGKNCRCTWY